MSLANGVVQQLTLAFWSVKDGVEQLNGIYGSEYEDGKGDSPTVVVISFLLICVSGFVVGALLPISASIIASLATLMVVAFGLLQRAYEPDFSMKLRPFGKAMEVVFSIIRAVCVAVIFAGYVAIPRAIFGF